MFKIKKSQSGQAVAELLGDIDVVMPHLEFGMLFHAAD